MGGRLPLLTAGAGGLVVEIGGVFGSGSESFPVVACGLSASIGCECCVPLNAEPRSRFGRGFWWPELRAGLMPPGLGKARDFRVLAGAGQRLFLGVGACVRLCSEAVVVSGWSDAVPGRTSATATNWP